jgi:hypothetical protein
MTTKIKEQVLSNLKLTSEEEHQYDLCTQYLDADDHLDVLDQAFEVGSEQFFKEQAMSKLIPILARAIDRELRRSAEEEDSDKS